MHHLGVSPGLTGQSSNDPSMMEVRPPFFLHGNKRNGTWVRALPNARTVAGGTIPQPFPQEMALILGSEFPIWVQVFIACTEPS